MSTTTPPPPRPKWRFRIFQFSIRTLLLLTAAVAIFCNWYFQPQRKDEELAGGMLKLRRQVRVEMRSPPAMVVTGAGGTGPTATQPAKVPYYINHGSWSLLDKDDNLLARGQYVNDVPNGWWTIWHVSGMKGAEGRMKNGAKSGLWKTWYEDGTLQSEVNYAAAVPAGKVADKGPATPKLHHSKFPLEMSAYPREGIAKAWYASGQLKFTGSYQDDKEEGPWQLYGEDGKLTASGPYLHGQRHGSWKLVDTAGKEATIEYVHGRKADELKAILAKLTEGLKSENSSHRLRAAFDLADLGEDGLPALIGALKHSSTETRVAAVRSLLRLGPAAASALPQLKELVASKPDSPLKFQAMLAIYVIDPASRAGSYDEVTAQAAALADPGETCDALGRIFECDPDRQEQTLKKMLVWEADNTSRSGQVRAMLSRSGADVVATLDNLYSPSLHIASRKTIASIMSGLPNVRHPQFEPLVDKIKAESDPELKQAGEELEARIQENQQRGGGGLF